MIKVPKARFLAFALCAAMVLVFWQGNAGLAWDNSNCIVKLPPNCSQPPSAVQVTNIFANEGEACEDILDSSNMSYFDTTIKVVSGDFSTPSGIYEGWCLTTEIGIFQDDSFGANLYSSLDTPKFPDDITLNISEKEWTQINCLLNQTVVKSNWLDEQAAYWTILEGDYPGFPDFPVGEDFEGCPEPFLPDPNVVNDLIVLANSDFCLDFKPAAGQKVAVVVQPLKQNTCVNDPQKQLNIIEAECCKFIKKLVSVDRGETFVDADTVDMAAIEDGMGAIYKIIVTNCGDDKIKAKIEDVDLGFFPDEFYLGPGEKKYFEIDKPNVCDDFVCDSDSDSDNDSDIDIDCDSDSNGDGCNGEVEKVCKENVAELFKYEYYKWKFIDDDPAWVCCDCDFDGDSDSDSDY